jgi:penicillin-insensitive murein endopeptidase
LAGALAFPEQTRGAELASLKTNEDAHYGTVEVVQALVRAAARVARERPGSTLVVKDLSFAQGGPIPRHGSHQAGRDVDLLFYLLDESGSPRPSKGVPLDPEGTGWDFNDLARADDDLFVRLDAERTFLLLQALVEDEEALLQRIFVAEHLRTLILAAGQRLRPPAETMTRLEELTCQPGTPHDDHLHLRFFCTNEDIRQGCLDLPPLYPWRRTQLRQAGLRPALGRPRANRKRAPTVSAAQARAKAGPLHEKVQAFLDRRARWSKGPHPGRPFCR